MKILKYRTIAVIYPFLSLEAMVELANGDIVFTNLTVNSREEKIMDCENSHWTYSKPLTEMAYAEANNFEYDLSQEEDKEVCEALMRLWNDNPVFINSSDWKSCEAGIPDVESIHFRIEKFDNSMCHIVSDDIRSIYKRIAGGGCICSLDIALADMERITKEVAKLGNKAVFTFANMNCW